jgi:type IV pilus assembly protein PilC
MLDTGMTLITCLRTLENQERNPDFKGLIMWMRMDIEKGIPLSQSMMQFPTVFDVTYVSMIKAAEKTGTTPETLKELAAYIEAAVSVRRKIRSAMIYPIVVLGIAFGVGALMVIFVVPTFSELYGSLGQKLPAPTRFLLRLSSLFRSYGFLVLLALAAMGATPHLLRRTPAGRRIIDRLVLVLPVFGVLAQKFAAARFARTFGSLIRSGVPVLSALDISAGAAGNAIVSEAILRARASVEQGNPLSLGFTGQRVVPAAMVDMLRTGEQTGRIDEMLLSMAQYYEEEVNTMVAGLTALLQPLLIVIVGIIVTVLAVGALMPLLQAPGLIQ